MLHIGSDNTITLRNHADATTGEPITEAAVVAKITDADGVVVYTVTLSHIEEGDYAGLLGASESATLTPDGVYRIDILAVSDMGILRVTHETLAA